MRRAALTFVAFLAGCSFGGDKASIDLRELPRLVIQPQDLPRVFLRFDQGRQLIGDSPGGSRSDPTRFGRKEGWKARYRRAGSARTAGPLVVESKADLFDSSGGAADDFEAARSDVDESELPWKPIDEPGLGDESFAATVVQGGVRYYQVVWRDDNLTASVNVNGFENRLPLADVLELARKQQSHISDVTE